MPGPRKLVKSFRSRHAAPNYYERYIMKHPIQPLETDEAGTLRFKENKIIRWLLDTGKLDLNEIAMQGFPVEDQEQLAQLIGYSLNGFGELSYVGDDTYDTACKMLNEGSEKQARLEMLEEKLSAVRSHAKELASTVFRIHPDDLYE